MGINNLLGKIKAWDAKVRYWDSRSAKWMMRHFYILFFEIILVGIFLWCFINNLKLIDVNSAISQANLVEHLLLTQTINSVIIIVLLLLNSFWMLFIFNNIIRFRALLKEMNFNLSKRRSPPISK